MKTLLTSALIAMTTVGSFAAEMTVARQKELCERSIDKIWVENKNACVPIHACKENNFANYCDKTFRDIQVSNAGMAQKLANIYVKQIGIQCDTELSRYPKLFGQDFVSCYNKDYLEFEFDDIAERNAWTAQIGYMKGLCLAFGGENPIADGGKVGCHNIQADKCTELSKEASLIDVTVTYGDTTPFCLMEYK